MSTEPTNNSFFSIHSLSGTGFVLLITFLLSMLTVNIDFFNPLVRALEDFNMTDVVYRDFKDSKGINPDIVLVNIGGAQMGRGGMAAQIERINEFEPKLIGIDAFFKRPKDPFQDSLLAAALLKVKQLVLVSKLDSLDEEQLKFRHLTLSAPPFMTNAHSGFANFITDGDDGYLTTRRFAVKEPLADSSELSFCAKILQLVDSAKYSRLMKRSYSTEIINYSGNLDNFYRLDYDDLFNPDVDLNILRNKIVLMGYLGDRMGEASLTDIFYTPLNPQLGGRSVPDMYGITVHANILSMMLGEYYIDQAPEWLDPLLALIFCLFNVSIFMFIGDRYSSTSQLMMRIIQIFQGVILMALVIYFLSEKDFYFEITITLTVIFLTADLTEIYDGSIKEYIDRIYTYRRIRMKRAKKLKA